MTKTTKKQSKAQDIETVVAIPNQIYWVGPEYMYIQSQGSMEFKGLCDPNRWGKYIGDPNQS